MTGLYSLANQKKHFVKDCLDTFLKDVPKRINKIDHALILKNAKAIQMEAHSLKSSSALFNAADMSSLCLELETAARDGKLEGIQEIITQLKIEYEQVKTALELVIDKIS
ncbi:histidine phosphotransfer protein HptB [Candidatus Magnetomoraceae bacterium gMMP-13]